MRMCLDTKEKKAAHLLVFWPLECACAYIVFYNAIHARHLSSDAAGRQFRYRG